VTEVQPQQHEMVLEKIHESGAEEWFCPTCGRRFLMQWPPAYKKIILEPGDDYAAHSGGKGGLIMGAIQTDQKEDTSLGDNDSGLAPWIAWMEKVDFDKLWDR
jgi:hypothetical protein